MIGVISSMVRITLTFVLALMLSATAWAGNWNKGSNSPKSNIELSFTVNRQDTPLNAYVIRNTLHLPKSNDETYGVVVLLHSCGGISPKNQNDLVRWGKLLLDNGYAVLFIDHLGPRGVKKNCGRSRPLNSTILTKDVYAATNFLNTQPKIDKTRIFTLGFSLGAMTGGALATQENHARLGKDAPRPRAVAGLYGGCYGGEKWLQSSADIPVLWLVGSNDNESPPNSCSGAVNALQKKGLITFHQYPNATHCWDCADLDGFSKTAGNGNRVTYKFDSETTKDSERRVIEFFNSFKNE